ncbi:unnamed protein product [Cylicocyclus nassatus]|uniref:TIL domain-containing protein n=1 Tax=Cylicocyclus nassatus TaxID=53992 RepID=A0AA36DKX4_CYLNA|nr:unnamed protein product [Cylicocyclus nassatus]
MHHLMVPSTLLLLLASYIYAQLNETETIDAENSTEIVTTAEIDTANSTEIVTTMESDAGNGTETVSTEESSQATSSNGTLKLDQIDDGKCGQHEVWKECSGCESSCEQMKVICDDSCGEPKCQCDVGYFRYAPRKCITYWECKNGVIEL